MVDPAAGSRGRRRARRAEPHHRRPHASPAPGGRPSARSRPTPRQPQRLPADRPRLAARPRARRAGARPPPSRCATALPMRAFSSLATVASGITSFEGGGLTYNIPYCKDVPLAESLAAWRDVDQLSGDLAAEGVIVDRELFGTLTAVLMPPCVGISIALIEAILAAQAGVRCLSMAYCQTGHFAQDIAALRAPAQPGGALPARERRRLPGVPPVHGRLPRRSLPRRRPHRLRRHHGAARGARPKIINKTHQEAFGVPTVEANVAGIGLTRMATSWILDLVPRRPRRGRRGAALDRARGRRDRRAPCSPRPISPPRSWRPSPRAGSTCPSARASTPAPTSCRCVTRPAPSGFAAGARSRSRRPSRAAMRGCAMRPARRSSAGSSRRSAPTSSSSAEDTAPLRAQHQAAA